MRTTLLNGTVWLLAATAIVGLIGRFHGRDARHGFEALVRRACSWPVLIPLVLLSCVGLGSRIVLGFLAPGAYAEEVVAARSFLEERQLYDADPRQELQQWSAEGGSATTPWAEVPGVGPCQAGALNDRGRFFTNHAHTPMLLLAGVPIVKVGGGRAVFVVLLLLSLAGVVAITAVLLAHANVPWRSRHGLLLLAAVGGWQPVLAGIRQGDAVLPVAALGVVAGHLAGQRQRPAAAAMSAGLAACFALPAIGVLPALLRSWIRPGIAALLLFLIAIAATMAVAGTSVVSSFVQTAANTAGTYAFGLTNYSVCGRAQAAGVSAAAVIGALLLVVLVSWVRGRTADDAFAAFAVVGLLVAPVVWSQHLALVLVPAVVLLQRLLWKGSSLALAAWAGLILLFSLPDASAAWFSEKLPIRFTGAVLPVLSVALMGLWGWIVIGAGSRRFRPRVTTAENAAPAESSFR